MNLIHRTILLVAAVVSPLVGYAQHYSLTWKNFNVKDDTGLEIIGHLNTRPSDGTGDSYWSIGCETLDRDMADFSSYREFVGELGVGYARIQSGWAKCEREKGKYDFEWLDEIVDGLLEEGVKPWMCLCYGNPIYNDAGADLGSTIFTDKKVMKAWLKYVDAVTKRYKGKVTMYEIWNEPNLGKNTERPEAYADLFVNTARQIRKNDAKVRMAGLSLSGRFDIVWAGKVLDSIKEKKASHLLEYATFHPYYPNPDDVTDKIHAFRELVKSYNPETEILQGETGCPSILEWGHALSYREWSEYSQVKWIMRRMANDFMLGIPSSIFTMVDLQYRNMLQSFGMIRMNLLKEPMYKRPAFYGVRNMANLLTTEMTAYSDGLELEANVGRSIGHTGIMKNGKPVGLMFWFCDQIPSDSIEKEEITFTVRGVTMKNPVLLDPITGRIYSLKDVVLRGGNEAGRMKFTKLPMWDSPLIVIEKDVLDAAPVSESVWLQDSKSQETFI